MDYKLFLYKDTPIIHNLIPNKRTFNKKKVVDLAQGFCGGTSYDARRVDIYHVPYFDSLNIERAVVIIRLQTITGQENWDIQINNKDGEPICTHLVETRQVTKYIPFPSRCTSIDYHEDMSKIEKSMKALLEEHDQSHNAQQKL